METATQLKKLTTSQLPAVLICYIFKQAWSLQQQNPLTLHLHVHLTCVNITWLRELKLTWDDAQNRAKLGDCYCVMSH